jgi:uncharacterized protein (UPF0332 family)
MKDKKVTLCLARFKKAQSDFDAALVLLQEDMLLQALNRAYFSIFHSVKALLALDSFETKKHSGVIAYFNEHYVKTGVFEKELSKILMGAENIRNLSDYDDYFEIDKEDVKTHIDNAHIFIHKIQEYLSKKDVIKS